MLVLESIFEANNLLIFLNTEVWDLLVKFYLRTTERFFSMAEISSDSLEEIDILSLLTLFVFNKTFTKLIRFYKIPIERQKPLDMMLSYKILDTMTNHVLPTLRDENFLPREDGKISYKEKMLNRDSATL